MCVPASIYAIQNNINFIAISNLDAAVYHYFLFLVSKMFYDYVRYQVTFQLKILTAALFSSTMLRKDIKRKQWIALLFLMCGVSAVQLELQYKSGKKGVDDDSQNPVKVLCCVHIFLFIAFIRA